MQPSKNFKTLLAELTSKDRPLGLRRLWSDYLALGRKVVPRSLLEKWQRSSQRQKHLWLALALGQWVIYTVAVLFLLKRC